MIGENDFHGAVYYGELKNADLSYAFIDAVERKFRPDSGSDVCTTWGKGLDEVMEIAGEYGIDDINLVKPGIGETTRVLLRRVPWKVLINVNDKDSPRTAHIVRLAEEKEVPVVFCPLKHYKACGIIKKLADT